MPVWRDRQGGTVPAESVGSHVGIQGPDVYRMNGYQRQEEAVNTETKTRTRRTLHEQYEALHAQADKLDARATILETRATALREKAGKIYDSAAKITG